jgi:hypothetical protein
MFVLVLGLPNPLDPGAGANQIHPLLHTTNSLSLQLLSCQLLLSGMASTPSYLIIVCAHAVFHGSDPTRAEHWALQSFQRAHGSKPSEHFIFIRHIEESMKILNNSPAGDNLIVFSGGATNPSYPYLSEAQGYMNVATWLLSRSSTLHSELLQQVITEEHATDTFQNILFSILKFYYIKQKYPSHVIVITHAFKSDRVELHRQAISWTRSFHINGIDPEFDSKYIYDRASTLICQGDFRLN